MPSTGGGYESCFLKARTELSKEVFLGVHIRMVVSLGAERETPRPSLLFVLISSHMCGCCVDGLGRSSFDQLHRSPPNPHQGQMQDRHLRTREQGQKFRGQEEIWWICQLCILGHLMCLLLKQCPQIQENKIWLFFIFLSRNLVLWDCQKELALKSSLITTSYRNRVISTGYAR